MHKLKLEEEVIFFKLRYLSWEIPIQSRLIFRNTQSGQMGSKTDYSQGTLIWELIFKMFVYKWFSVRSRSNSLNLKFQDTGCPLACSYHYTLPHKDGYLRSYFRHSVISDWNSELQVEKPADFSTGTSDTAQKHFHLLGPWLLAWQPGTSSTNAWSRLIWSSLT